MRLSVINCFFIALHCTYVASKPGGVAHFSASANVKPPITFDGANVGVNFGGYHASAGLGGILTGDVSKGGLHAEAGTPFGQQAGAGLGGAVVNGGAGGGLYAGATSGVGQTAVAGIGGAKSASGSIGGSMVAATSGESYVSKVVERHQAPVVVEKTVQGTPTVQKTYVERTVIPNYVEKTIQVPSYVEKTVRVPTVVEQKVRVAAAPTIIEKTVDVPTTSVEKTISTDFNTRVSGDVGFSTHSEGAVVVQKPPPVFVRKQWGSRFGGQGGFLGGLFGFSGGGRVDTGAAVGAGSANGEGSKGVGSGSASYTFRKTANPQLINDIFNIPISTLGAVNRLVKGIVGGTSGSVSVEKHYSAY